MPELADAYLPIFQRVVVHTNAPQVTFALFPRFELVVIAGADQGAPLPAGFYVQLLNGEDEVVRVLDKQIEAMDWQFNRQGGCGSFNVRLKERYGALDDLNIDPSFSVAIHEHIAGASHMLWFRGAVDKKEDDLDSRETISLSGYGYSRQLSRVVVAATYGGENISAIVSSILEDFVAPNTDIRHVVNLIHPSAYTADTIVFNTTADKALKELADLIGYEFGVDKERRFYFGPAGVTVMHRFFIGGDVQAYKSPVDWDGIVNKLHIQGKDGLRAVVENVGSQALFGVREGIVVNASIASDSVAQKYGQSYLRDKAKPVRRARIVVRKVERPLEWELPPLGRVSVGGTQSGVSAKYGTAIYGQATYGGPFQAQAESVGYTWRTGKPSAVVQLGSPKDEMARTLKQVELEIDALREV